MKEFNLENQDRSIQFKNMTEAFNAKDSKPFSTSPLRSSKMRSLLNSYYFKEAYQHHSKVAFTGEQFPNELLYALNIVSLNLESLAALFSSSNCIMDCIKMSDESYLSRDICSNVRSSFGVAASNYYPKPDLILASSHPCDGLIKLSYFMSKLYNCNYHMLDIPNFINENSVDYLARQLKRLVEEVVKEFNIPFDEDKFREVVRYSNEAKKYFLKTLELCQEANLPHISKETFGLIVSNLWGSKELVSVCKIFYDEAFKESQKAHAMKKRALWIGQVPFYSNELIAYLENTLELFYLGACDGVHAVLIDENDPWASMAKRSIQYMWEPVRMRKELMEVCQKFKIEGVILLNAWGCRNLLGVNQMLRDAVRDMNLRFLTIDVDYMDKDKFAFSQVKNRVDAFLEII